MKSPLLILAAAVAFTASALAQGKVTALNSPATEIYIDPVHNLDFPIGGQPVPTTGALPISGIFLDYGLYVGSSSSSLQLLIPPIPINLTDGTGTPPGLISPFHYVLPAPFVGGTAWDFQVRIWDAAYTSFEAEEAAVGLYGVDNTDYLGENSVFTMTPGSYIAYPFITTAGGSTYAQVHLDVLAFTPEPSAFAFAGLFAAALLIFRPRK